MDIIFNICGIGAIFSAGWELRKVGDERNWPRFAEAITLIILGLILISK